MNLLIWLDLPLIVFGLLAMSPGLWYTFRLRRIDKRSAFGRVRGTAMALLFFLGFGALMAAGVDAGLAKWERACRPGGNDKNIQLSMMAPDFTLLSLDEGRTIRLSDFRGHKPVVLVFGNFY